MTEDRNYLENIILNSLFELNKQELIKTITYLNSSNIELSEEGKEILFNINKSLILDKPFKKPYYMNYNPTETYNTFEELLKVIEKLEDKKEVLFRPIDTTKKEAEVLLSIEDIQGKGLTFYHPSWIGIVGLNGQGKSLFSYTLLSEVVEITEKKGIIILTENTKLFRFRYFWKLNKYVEKGLLKIVALKDVRGLLDNTFLKEFSYILLDSVFWRFNGVSFDEVMREFCYQTLEKEQTVILINHVLKQAKTSKKTNEISIYDGYSGDFVNLIDMGMVLRLNNNRLVVDIQKNRFSNEEKGIYIFDFEDIIGGGDEYEGNEEEVMTAEEFERVMNE